MCRKPDEAEPDAQHACDVLVATLVLDLAGGLLHHRPRRRDYLARQVARYILAQYAAQAHPHPTTPRR